MDKKKIALLSVGAVVLGVSGYFAYRGIRKFISNLGNKDDKKTPPSSAQSQGNVGSTPTASTSSNPFSTKAELLAFQQWVINVKKDKNILGSGGASGFGDDGLWGRKSAQAWNKYGNEYKNVKLDTSMGGGANTTSDSGSWSSNDSSARIELKDRVEDLGYDTNDLGSNWEWDVAGKWVFPTTFMKFYNNGVFTLEKKKSTFGDRYGKISGNWSKVSNGWKFIIGGKTYNAPYSGSGLSDKLWGILKDNGFYSKTNGKFIEFDQQPMKKRNRTQLDMGCEDLM